MGSRWHFEYFQVKQAIQQMQGLFSWATSFVPFVFLGGESLRVVVYIFFILLVQSQCRPHGSEALPEGIISRTSNLELMPLWGYTKVCKKLKYMNPYLLLWIPSWCLLAFNFNQKNKTDSSNLFAAAVGIKQKDLVNKMVTKVRKNTFFFFCFLYLFCFCLMYANVSCLNVVL